MPIISCLGEISKRHYRHRKQMLGEVETAVEVVMGEEEEGRISGVGTREEVANNVEALSSEGVEVLLELAILLDIWVEVVDLVDEQLPLKTRLFGFILSNS